MRILILTAHTDDLENGMGGTIMRLANAGHEICSIVLTLPVDPAMKHTRILESRRSHKEFGVIPLFFDYPDGKLESTMENRLRVSDMCDTLKPEAIFSLSPTDVHPDHRATADMSMNWALQRGRNTELFFFETCASGRHSPDFRPQALAFYPTHYVDTTSVQDQKKVLMDYQASQDPVGMWRGMRNVHENRGREANCPYAEAFVRATRVGDIHPELQEIFIPTPFCLPRGIGVDFLPNSIGL